MRSTSRPDDLTTRAKIRDAAIEHFGSHGFGRSTIRSIAERAGVSAALVIHHFGSKQGLRETCDAYVTDIIDEQTAYAAEHVGAADVLAMMARRPDFGSIAPYVMTTLQEGGGFAVRLFGRLVDDMEHYLQATVAAGVTLPTEDERARAEMVTLVKLGLLAFASYVVPQGTTKEDVLEVAARRLTVPALELFTHGLYTGTDYLDAYREQHLQSAHRKGEEA